MRHHRVVDSPLGPLTLTWDDRARGSDGATSGVGALCGLHVHDQRERPTDPSFGELDDGTCVALDALEDELDAYFAGRLRVFATPVAPSGSPFARAVAGALRAVPYGTTTTYGALAAAIGRPKAAQAVGTANARNPISLLVPCHRVLSAAGAPSGGGPGIARKRWLQALEAGPPIGLTRSVRARRRG